MILPEWPSTLGSIFLGEYNWKPNDMRVGSPAHFCWSKPRKQGPFKKSGDFGTVSPWNIPTSGDIIGTCGKFVSMQVMHYEFWCPSPTHRGIKSNLMARNSGCWESIKIMALHRFIIDSSCIYIYIHIYIYTYIHIYIYTYIHIYIYIYIHIHIYTYTYIYIYTYIHIYIYTYIHIYIYTYIHVYIYIHIYILSS